MIKSRNIIRLICSLLLFGMIGCAGQADNLPTATPVSTEIATLTPRIVNTATQTPTATVTSVPDPITNRCVELGRLGMELPPPVETANHWLLLTEDQPPYSPYLINLANGIENLLSDPNSYQFFISPDHRRLAYTSYTNSISSSGTEKLVVTDVKHQFVKNIPWEKDWTFFFGWLDNNHLMVTKASEGEWVPSLVILGLSDNSRRELKSEYPGFDNVNYLNWQFNRVIYDATLSFAFYPSYEERSSSMTLFDITNNKVVTEILVAGSKTKQPEWSPDGQYLAVAGTVSQRKPDEVGYIENYNQELLLLDKNGNTTRLTRFADKHDEVRIGNLSWSPDGEKIAFWFSLGESREEKLAVIDLETNLVTNYCITGSYQGFSMKPVWSPDGKIVVVNSKQSKGEPTRVIWVDTNNAQGDIMGEGILVEGWLIAD